MLSLTVLPFSNPTQARAQEPSWFAAGLTTGDFLKDLGKSPAKARGAQQDPVRPTPPTPGIGSGGNGPGGSFNVAAPERRQGPPPGVRDVREVLNEVRTPPRIPDPIPSTESYCWPGDPACRKPLPTAKPRPAGSKPTPPPRPQLPQSSVRPDLLVASNGSYVGKLLANAAPYVSHFWRVDGLPRGYELFTTNRDSSPQVLPISAPFVKSAAADNMSIWADCNTVEGYADGAQTTVYIYVDSANVGSTSAQGGNYFSFDISAYVNDGMWHEISAWYYTMDWIWMEAGTTSVSGCWPVFDFDTPRLEERNETGDPGVDPGSQNINWSVPLVSLPGRGVDLDLLLTYNSLVWVKSADGSAMMFDPDHGFPSPGFRLRFPIIQPLFFNQEVNVWSYMFVTSTGGRIELRHVDVNEYESADSSYMKMVVVPGSATVWLRDGTQLSFTPSINDELRCTQIKDRNGNFISVTYTARGNINTATDTLGRQIVFNYDGNYRLLTITQNRTGLDDTLVTFGYENASFSPSFPGLFTFAPTTSTIPVLNQVAFADGTRFNFEYTTFGQVNKIRRHAADKSSAFVCPL